jgi:SAM-dependent methyltransferase
VSTFPEVARTVPGLDRAEPFQPVPVKKVIRAGKACMSAPRTFALELTRASARLVDEARTRSSRSATPIASLSVADARRLPQENDSAAAVLVMGPLYHLPFAADRVASLREALRVLAPGGIAVVAAISRYASALDGLARKLSLDPRFVKIRDRDLADGQHRNDTDHADYFTTAYFHRPDDLRFELEVAGFRDITVLGVEGPAWMLHDFDARWEDSALRKGILEVARALESESSVIGVSAHLLGIGRKA